MSIDGLRYLSVLKLPVQDDMLIYFKTELLGEIIHLKGHVIWKGEVNDEITEYEVKFIIQDKRTNYSYQVAYYI